MALTTETPDAPAAGDVRPGSRLEELNLALVAAFDHAVFARMLRFKLGRRLDAIINPAAGLAEVVFRVTNLAEQEGWTDNLIAAAAETVPGNEPLCRFCERFAPAAMKPKSPGELAKEAAAGLFALADRLARPGVREGITLFRGRFETTRQDIKRLAAYKSMHDQLHELQFGYYERIIRETARLPQDPDSAEELGKYEIDLGAMVGRLMGCLADLQYPEVEKKWITRLQRAVESLRKALAEADVKLSVAHLDDCLSDLDRLLCLQPALINSRMVNIAGKLQEELPGLITAMTCIPAADGPDVGGRPVDLFGAGLVALRGLQPRLAGAVEEHNHWQQMDNDLRFAADKLRYAATSAWDPLELRDLWGDIGPALADVCAGVVARWADELRTSAGELEAVLGGNELIPIRKAFDRFRRRGMLRFYDVDKQLNQLCGQLLLIGDPLEKIMELSHADD
jgi:hypothetical protein